MIRKPRTISPAVPILTCAMLALAGCGGGAPTHGNGPRGIFTSTNDCAAAPKFDFEPCAKAITAAIKDHNEKSPTYESERLCGSKEGACERTLNDLYRPRLLGFYVELPDAEAAGKGQQPIGKPLYVSTGKQKGFRALDNTVYLETDLTLNFSRAAIAAYKAHSAGVKKAGWGS
jgi:Protein of unknown function (DUF1190)